MADTKLFSRKQSGGVFSIYDAAVTTGEYFYVHSGTGSDTASTGRGKNPDAPYASIAAVFDAATAVLTAAKHDIIYVMPGHAETVATAGALDIDIAGVSIIGIGQGADQPTITLTDAASDIDIDAANITIENINFVANDDDVLVCLDVNADDFTVRNCRFTATAVTKNFHVCIQDAAATASDRITVEDCYALQSDAANTHFINFAGTPDGCIVRNNTLIGDWGTMAIGGAGEVTNCVVDNNLINNIATTVDGCINFAAAATGICTRNICGGGAAVVNGVTATAMTEAENYYQITTSDLSGVLDPANA